MKARTFKRKKDADNWAMRKRYLGYDASVELHHTPGAWHGGSKTSGSLGYTVTWEKKSNPGGRKLTKAQKRVNASKRSTKRRVAKALQKFLKAQNPAAKFAGAKIRRNKGSITIIPIKLRRASR
jgi:hypothetical protein